MAMVRFSLIGSFCTKGFLMARIRNSDLVLELAEVCRDIKTDLLQRLSYYRASAYKQDAVLAINERVDQLRALFQILDDEELLESMHDHDSVLRHGSELAQSGECTVSARIGILISEMDIALQALVRRCSKNQEHLAPAMIQNLKRHKQTLLKVCPEGSRSREILRSL
jgi:hypothetical protein